MTADGRSCFFRLLGSAAFLGLAAAVASAYVPPTTGTHGNPGDWSYQIADGGPDVHGWFGKDPSTCNPDSSGFCDCGPDPGLPQCVGFGDSRIVQTMLGVAVVTVSGQKYFDFTIQYEFPNLYCVIDPANPPVRGQDSFFNQRMWLASDPNGQFVIGPGVAVAWFEKGFWKPRLSMDCTLDYFYVTFEECEPFSHSISMRTIGPFKLPSRKQINGVCRLRDPRNCPGLGSGPGSGVFGPVNVGSGDVSYSESLFQIAGIAPGAPNLSLALGYASSQDYSGFFGTSWSSTLTESIEAVSGTSGNLLHRRTAASFDEYYTHDAATNTWQASLPAELRGSIANDGTYYALTDLNGTVTRFEVGTGRWFSNIDRWGNAITANYSGMPASFTVIDSQGRTLTLTLTGGLITQVQDSDGNTWRFSYSGGYLTQILDPFHLSSGFWRAYAYTTLTGVSPNPLSSVSDELSKVLEGFTFDALGRVITTFAEGNQNYGTIEYDTPAVGQSRVKTRIDNTPTDQVSVFDIVYQGGRYLATRINGNCSSCSGADGDDQTFTYDTANHVVVRKVGVAAQSEQVETDFTYDANGMVLTRSEAGIRMTTYAYAQGTPAGFLKAWPSFVTSITENSVVKVSPQLTKTTSSSWSSSGTCSGSGAETCLQTTVAGYLTSADPGTSYQTTTRFDSKHRQTEVDGPELVGGASANRKTAFLYFGDTDATLDRRGRLQKTSVYTSVSVSLDTQYDTYDIFGTAKQIVDPNVVETDKTTDQKGRVTIVVSKKPSGDSNEPADYTTTHTYDLRDRLTKVTLPGPPPPSPSTNQIQYVYEDGTNRLTDTIRADAASSHNQKERLHLTLNGIGGKVQEDAQTCTSPASTCTTWAVPSARVENFKYDSHNRLSEIDHPVPSGSKILYSYDSRGNLKTVQDENHPPPLAANTTYAYDSLNRLMSVGQTLAGAPATSGVCAALANQIKTCYTYDTQDNLTSVIDPNGNPTNYTYDDFRRMQTQVSLVSGTTTYTLYDAAGNLLNSTDGNGVQTARTYDAANRILSSMSGSGSAQETVTWTYDDPDLTQFKYRQGRLNSMTDPSGSTTYAYERRGLLRNEAKTIDPNTYTLSYGYDANGNRSLITYPSGRVVTYTLDFADRPLSAASGGITYVSGAVYQPFGPESSLSFGNGTTKTATYDQRYRPTENKLGTIYDYFYKEDGVGNILSICQGAPCPSTTPVAAYDRVFAYDDLNRLTTAKSGTSLWGSGSGNGFAYDAMGNMTSLTLGSRAVNFSYFQSGGHLTSKLSTASDHSPTAVTYDAAGNETGVGLGIFTYSSRNYLASGDGFAYTYDGRGLRVSTTRTGVNLFPVSLTVDPISVKGGGSVTVTGTVTLNDMTGGTVTLSSSDTAVASVPASINVPAGLASQTFTVTTFAVTADTKVVITATIPGSGVGVALSATLNVTSASKLVLLSLSPRTVKGGPGATSTGTVALNGGAPAGAVVMLFSANTSAATVPGSVTVAQNGTTATFTVTTLAVSSSTSVDIKASYGGVDQHASLIVVNYAVQGISPAGPLLARRGRPLLVASLSAENVDFSGDSVFHRSDSNPALFRLTPGLDRETEALKAVGEDPIEQRMPIILAASFPGSPKRNFIYSPEMNLLAESELARPREKTILYEYIWFNGHPVAQIDGGTVTHWTFTDHLGTPLIQTTASQAVWWRAEYEPYGRVFSYNPPSLADQHQPLRLPGQEAEQFNLGQNAATERSYNVFRWYRSSWGRYTQPDPIGFGGGLNLYGYAGENPILAVDLLGLCCTNVDRTRELLTALQIAARTQSRTFWAQLCSGRLFRSGGGCGTNADGMVSALKGELKCWDPMRVDAGWRWLFPGAFQYSRIIPHSFVKLNPIDPCSCDSPAPVALDNYFGFPTLAPFNGSGWAPL